jgi:hypothetical protein
MPRVRIWNPVNCFNHGYLCQERDWILLTGLTMAIYMSRERWDPYKWFIHGYVYVKRELGSI